MNYPQLPDWPLVTTGTAIPKFHNSHPWIIVMQLVTKIPTLVGTMKCSKMHCLKLATDWQPLTDTLDKARNKVQIPIRHIYYWCSAALFFIVHYTFPALSSCTFWAQRQLCCHQLATCPQSDTQRENSTTEWVLAWEIQYPAFCTLQKGANS